MRRRLLIALTAVGSVIVVLGGLGVFAALTDQAMSGTNSVTSVSQPRQVDILISPRTTGSSGTGTCGEFTDDLTSPLFTIEALDVNMFPAFTYCLRNDGSLNAVQVKIGVQDLTDIDVSCTGDEKEYDETCGPGPEGQEQQGELADSITLRHYSLDCQTSQRSLIGIRPLRQHVSEPQGLGTLTGGSSMCFATEIALSPSTDLQVSQSDTVTWRFRWEATPAEQGP